VFDEAVRECDVVVYVYDYVAAGRVKEAVVGEAGCRERRRSWFVDLEDTNREWEGFGPDGAAGFVVGVIEGDDEFVGYVGLAEK
jgi:hypothetical protein